LADSKKKIKKERKNQEKYVKIIYRFQSNTWQPQWCEVFKTFHIENWQSKWTYELLKSLGLHTKRIDKYKTTQHWKHCLK